MSTLHESSQHRSGPFRLKGWVVASCFIVGVTVGAHVYSGCVRRALDATEKAYANARPIEHAFERDPAFGIRGRENERMTEATLLRLLRNYRLVPTDERKPPEQLKSAHEIGIGNGVQICSRGTGILFLLSAQYGKLARAGETTPPPLMKMFENCDWSPADHERAARTNLAMVLAGQPGALKRWQRCILDDGVKSRTTDEQEACLHPENNRAGFWTYLTPYRSEEWGAQATNDEILRTLFEQTGSAQPNWAPNSPSELTLAKSDEDENANYTRFVSYTRRLLGEMQDDPDVKWEKVWITIYMGPEQLAMVIVFSILILLLLTRWLARIRQAAPVILNVEDENGDDEDSALVINDRSRWLIRWMLRSLPALGFIGTVRSLTIALSNADSIVRADGAIEQATAISNVSTTLAVAFTTTLIALVLGLVAGLFNDWQVVQERRSIRRHYKAQA